MVIAAIVIIVFFILYITGVWDRLTGKTRTRASEHYPEWEPVAKQIISERMSYYYLLENDEQEMFIKRTFQVMTSLDFVSKEEGFEVTDEMKILISAAITQITFGWTEIKPPDLRQIGLFSESFYSDLVQADVKGLTLPGRTMLSWKYFQEGYKIDNDRINLGLHELAHAVWDERYTDGNVQGSLSGWEAIAAVEFGKMQRHIDSGFFRDYAATNMQELWACSIECFFEAPAEFHNKLPELYGSIAGILNQDMLGRIKKAKTTTIIA